jgi:hypothetical protein
MTNPDYRDLCAELAEAYVWCIEEYMTAPAEEDTLIQRARIALAQPVAEGPTDEELQEMWFGSEWFNEGATLREFISITRAVLAKWGHQ